MFELNEKNAIVTGASRGIGKEIALKLAKQGANIAVIDMNKNDDTLKEIADLGVKVKFYTCDVSNSEETKAVVKEIANDFGSVEILVNNAGITRDGLMLRMSDADYDLVLGINLKGAFNMTKACYQGFMRKRYGRIINITSVSGILGNAGQANYSASKAGLIGLTKTVARELAERGVTCNAVAPGFIQTDMTADLDLDNNPLMQSVPQKRLGTPDDIANAVVFLASDEASYITGEVVKVDGGMAM